MNLIIIVLLVLLLMGAFPVYPYSRDWGYSPTALILIILILFLLFGRGRF